jgi:predicted nucleotidyltransferase
VLAFSGATKSPAHRGTSHAKNVMAHITRQEVLDKIADAKDELRRMHVTRLELFGSVAREEAGEASDIDLLVEFDESEKKLSLLDVGGVQAFLEDLLGCDVDLVMRDRVLPELKDRIYSEAIRVA